MAKRIQIIGIQFPNTQQQFVFKLWLQSATAFDKTQCYYSNCRGEFKWWRKPCSVTINRSLNKYDTKENLGDSIFMDKAAEINEKRSGRTIRWTSETNFRGRNTWEIEKSYLELLWFRNKPSRLALSSDELTAKTFSVILRVCHFRQIRRSNKTTVVFLFSILGVI